MINLDDEIRYYKWKSDFHDEFKLNMNDDFICTKLINIASSLENECYVLENSMIENCILELNAILEHVAHPFECTYLNSSISSVSNANIIKNVQNTWYDSECQRKNNEFKAARNLFLDTKSDVDLLNMCNIRNSYRKMCRKKKSSYKIESANKLLKLSKENSKLFWKKIKNKKKPKVPNLDFDNHFKQLFSTYTPVLSNTTKVTLEVHNILKPVNHDLFLDSAITLDELNIALKNLKNDKSPGSDKIINEFLKYNTDIFKTTILKMFNVLFDKGYFPDAWSTGLIIPIFKAGNENEVNNYRGISLLSCVGKLFTSIINNRLNKWAESQSVFDQSQYGFRDKKSTIDAMFILQNVVDIFIENGNMLYVSFIDLKKAFDSTNHEVLWYKLYKNGINTKIISLLKCMYNKMKLCVKSTFLQNFASPRTSCKSKTDSNCSSCITNQGNFPNDFLFSTKAGVLQGESLSPFLFSMYLNDINNYMSIDPNVGISIYDFYLILLLFADDMVLFSHSRHGLQRGIDRLYKYCVDWGLIVSIQKTRCLVFKKGGKVSAQDVWSFNDEPLETVLTFKYLGFVFASSGRFKKGIENVVLKGQRACFKMISTIKDFSSFYPKNQISLFNSLVASVLSYGCEVWGLAEAKRIETIHLSFLKYVLKVKKSTPNCVVYNECNAYPLFLDRLVRIMNYWVKIIGLNDNDPLKILYQTSLQLNINDSYEKSNCWAINIRNILYKNGFGYVWQNQNFGIDKSFIVIFKTRIKDIFFQKNQVEINGLSINRLYRHLNVESNRYLFSLPNDYIRIALTKLRLSSHHLMIEKGRWNGINYVERKCILCDDLEDEYHFIMCCVKYYDLRKKYLPKDVYNNPSMFKFIKLLNSENLNVLKKLGLFIHFALKKHRDEDIFQ